MRWTCPVNHQRDLQNFRIALTCFLFELFIVFSGFTTTIPPHSHGSRRSVRRCHCPSEHILANAFDKFCRSAFPLMRLEGGHFLLFHCFHSRFSRGKECNWSVFEECILFSDSDQNAKGRFFEFPFPLSKNQGMVLQNLAVSIPACQKLRNGFWSNNLFPPPPARIPGMDFTQISFFPPSASNIGPLWLLGLYGRPGDAPEPDWRWWVTGLVRVLRRPHRHDFFLGLRLSAAMRTGQTSKRTT